MENSGMSLMLNLVYVDPVSKSIQSMLLELKGFNMKLLLEVSIGWELQSF